MSEAAVRERVRKQGWAAPGGLHDGLVGALKLLLPVVIGVLLAFLAVAPLRKESDLSFILDKNRVDVASERMRVQAANYRGQDNRGRPFVIRADSAVQATSADPIVDVRGMTAQIRLDDGPAMLRALRGRYNMESETVNVVGPIVLTAAGGYRLQTRDVAVDLNTRSLESSGRVDGRMPLGRFSANKLVASLPEQRVLLTGSARLHIVQGGLR